jgi:hypothetical protein
VAASGGCQELGSLRLSGLGANLDWLTHQPSLIVPSVRKLLLGAACMEEEEALLLCCSLVQMGYKHCFDEVGLRGHLSEALDLPVRACRRAILESGVVVA